MAWVSLCEASELLDGRGLYVEVDGFRLAVFREADTVHVMDNECPHAGGQLADGHLEAHCVICPLHHWAFRLDNGQHRDVGGFEVRIYPTRMHATADGRQLVQAELSLP